MSASDSIICEKYRKDAIIDQAHALYGTRYPANHTWAVIIEKTLDSRYKAHLIVYSEPDSLKEWTTLKSGMKETSKVKALEHLMEILSTDISQRFFRK